jgi:hypothetical protein
VSVGALTSLVHKANFPSSREEANFPRSLVIWGPMHMVYNVCREPTQFYSNSHPQKKIKKNKIKVAWDN